MELGDFRFGLACKGLCLGTTLLNDAAKCWDLVFPAVFPAPCLLDLLELPGFRPLWVGNSSVGIAGGTEEGGLSLLNLNSWDSLQKKIIYLVFFTWMLDDSFSRVISFVSILMTTTHCFWYGFALPLNTLFGGTVTVTWPPDPTSSVPIWFISTLAGLKSSETEICLTNSISGLGRLHRIVWKPRARGFVKLVPNFSSRTSGPSPNLSAILESETEILAS